MIAANMVTIEIINWRQYVARGDLKNIAWFKLSTDIAKDKKLYGLSPAQKWAFVVLVCEACKENDGGRVTFSEDYLLNLIALNKKELGPTLQHFVTVGLIEIVQDFSSPTDFNRKTFHAQPVEPVIQTRLDQTRLDESKLDQTRPEKTAETPPSDLDQIYDLSDSEMALGKRWLDMATAEMPHLASSKTWHVAKFAKDLRAVKTSLGYTDEQMMALYNWVSASEFWRPLACSPTGLLKKKDNEIRKIDTIISQMKSSGQRKREIAQEIRNDPDRPINPGGTLTYSRLLELTKGD